MVRYLIFLFFAFFIAGCQNPITLIDKYEPFNKEIYINTSEKKTNFYGINEVDHGGVLLKFLKNWVDNDIKTNGFEGLLTIDLVSISSTELLINNGIRIEMELEIDFIITKKTIIKKTLIKFKGKEFGEIKGDFSLNDKEVQINNIAKKIIERLSNKLYQEIN